MDQLKLPPFDIKVEEGKVFCLVRKKWVVLTPEEWVRQHFLNLLINHLCYPKGMIKLEHSHSYFKHQKRSDITVFSKESTVFLLVECKAVSVKIGQSVINQLGEYNKVLDAKYLAVTNGVQHFIWQKDGNSLEQQVSFPSYY